MDPRRESHTATELRQCIECQRPADSARGWRAYLVPDEPAWVVLYCPSCADREFGQGGGRFSG